MNIKKLPSQKTLQELFSYCPETGSGFWKKSLSNRALKGSAVECPSDTDTRYQRVTIKGVTYNWHRIVYKLYHGNFDESLLIDHINGNKQDNSIKNLRLVTPSMNQSNQKISKLNTSGRIGISWQEGRRKWEAYITSKRKLYKLGRFSELQDAIRAREKAEVKYGFHSNHGRATLSI